MAFTQWTNDDQWNAYRASTETVSDLPAGYYRLSTDNNNRLLFNPVPPRDDTLLQFPDSAAGDVISGITDFWSREKTFRKYGLPFKRGILLHGPAGTGKTSTLQIIARKVIAMDGIVLNYHPDYFNLGYRNFREIQPETPLVVFIEDIELYESTDFKNMSGFLNMLDGAENIDRVVFLATTNHPEKLSARIINRPSRFDMTIEVPPPSIQTRRLYIESLAEHEEIEVERYVKDTEGFSFAHVKELFVATMILGRGYEESVARLKAMHLTPWKPSDQPSANGAVSGQYL
jgi:AAA+ superfamily predicted ATPase